jgi:hypothetical protein
MIALAGGGPEHRPRTARGRRFPHVDLLGSAWASQLGRAPIALGRYWIHTLPEHRIPHIETGEDPTARGPR